MGLCHPSTQEVARAKESDNSDSVSLSFGEMEPYDANNVLVDLQEIRIKIDLEGQSGILSDDQLRLLIHKCPQEAKIFPWKRIYRMGRDGNSMLTFKEKMQHRKETLMIIESTDARVFGCYANAAWTASDISYGDHATFVWRLQDFADEGKHEAAQSETETEDTFRFGSPLPTSLPGWKNNNSAPSQPLCSPPDSPVGLPSFGNFKTVGAPVRKSNLPRIRPAVYSARQRSGQFDPNQYYHRSLLVVGELRIDKTKKTEFYEPHELIEQEKDDEMETGPAIVLGENFSENSTHPCLVFKSPNLIDDEEDHASMFVVKEMEIWAPNFNFSDTEADPEVNRWRRQVPDLVAMRNSNERNNTTAKRAKRLEAEQLALALEDELHEINKPGSENGSPRRSPRRSPKKRAFPINSSEEEDKLPLGQDNTSKASEGKPSTG